jgi:hypothetical protein
MRFPGCSTSRESREQFWMGSVGAGIYRQLELGKRLVSAKEQVKSGQYLSD